MNWVTVIWSVVSGVCLMLGLMHLVIWLRDRRSWASLWFSITVFGVIGQMVCELTMMHAASTRVYEQAGRAMHVLYFFITLGLLGFVQSYFGTGRRWLAGLALGLRLLALGANFTTGANLHLVRVDRLKQIPFLGEQITVMGEWVPNPWVRLGQVASLVLLVYVVDASWRLWHQDTPRTRRRAVLLGGGLAFFILLAPLLPALVMAGVTIPVISSLPFVGMILAMNGELSGRVLRAARLSLDLKASEQRLELAAAAARLALWELDVPTGRIWVSDQGRGLYGVAREVAVDRGVFLATLHEDDRPVVSRAMEAALSGAKHFSEEYRVVLADGSWRWIAATGQVERDERGRAILMRGVSMDCTDRKLAESRMEVQRQELAHLSRVSLLGEMAGALAHELNQPLAAMLSNAQVGRRSLQDSTADLQEMGEIFDDIAADAKRAGGVIHGMRAMLKKDAPPEIAEIDMNEAVKQVLGLLNTEILRRNLDVSFLPGVDLRRVRAGRVEVQQVILNLVINGLDAMKLIPARGCLHLSTAGQGNTVVVAVHDEGPGIAPEHLARLFEPFFSTKPGGLGLGLSISRSILERFGGELQAENHPDGGAVFRMVLPGMKS